MRSVWESAGSFRQNGQATPLQRGGGRAGTVTGGHAKIWEGRERRGGESSGREIMCQSPETATSLADSTDSKRGQ